MPKRSPVSELLGSAPMPAPKSMRRYHLASWMGTGAEIPSVVDGNPNRRGNWCHGTVRIDAIVVSPVAASASRCDYSGVECESKYKA